MLARPIQKERLGLVPYFVFWIPMAVYFILISCSGVRKDMIPSRNDMLGKLTDEGQEAYLELMEIAEEDISVKLEARIQSIQILDQLQDFIKDQLQAQKKYKQLLDFLPKSEAIELKKKIAETRTLEEGADIIEQQLNQFSLLQSTKHQQLYVDLVQVLPDDQTIQLKSNILGCANTNQIDQLILSKLPASFKKLDNDCQASFRDLSPVRRQKILIESMKPIADSGHDASAIDNNNLEDEPNAQIFAKSNKNALSIDKQRDSPCTNGHSNDSAIASPNTAKDDIRLLIDKVAKEDLNNEDIPVDSWGSKLPLRGKERKDFFKLIMQFPQSDQKTLKKLFDLAEEISIQNFLLVYATGFNVEERINLLSTMIYLYKLDKNLTIKLCNDPESLSTYDEMSIWKKTNTNQLNLLKKLRDLLNEYEG